MVRNALRALAVIVLILLVAIGTAVAVVLSGPTEFGVVRDRIAGILRSGLGPGYRVDVGKAVVDLDPSLGLVVQVGQIEVHDSEDALVARVPATRLALDPFSLLRLKVDVRTVELTGAEVSFVRATNGGVYLGNSATAHAAAEEGGRAAAGPDAAAPAGDGGFPDLFRALQILDHGIEPQINAAMRQGFQRFSLVDSTIDVWDAERAQQRRFPSTDLAIEVDPATSALKVNFAAGGYSGRWSATLDREIDSAGTRTMSAVFSQLTLSDILPNLADDTGPITADIPVYGRANFALSPSGEVENANIRLDLGAGSLSLGENKNVILIDEATVKLRWDVANKAIVVDPSAFYFGDTRGIVTGVIRPIGDPAERRYTFDLESRGAVLAPRDSNERPIVAQSISVSGNVDVPKKMVTVDNAAIVTPDASVSAAGSIGFDGATPSVAMAASFSPMSVASMKQMWLPFLAPPARKWVMEHVTGGRVAAGRFEAAIPGGVLWTGKRQQLPEDMMRLDLRLEDVTFSTFGELPPVINATGNAVLAGSTFGVDVEKGEIRVPSGAIVTVNNGAFAIANTAQRYPEGVIAMQLSGDAGPLAEIANSKPFAVMDKRSINPADLSGTGDASVNIRLPLRPQITMDDVEWKVVANATDLASKTPVEGRMFKDAKVTIAVDTNDVTVEGRARIDGVLADISMSQPISQDGEATAGGDRQVRLTLDDAARKRLGVGLDEVLSGSIGATVSNIEDGSKGQHYVFDLKRARLMLAGAGWSKGIGVPATLTFDLKPLENGYAVQNLVLKGDGFGMSGSAQLDSSYGLISADIDRLSLHKGDSVGVKLSRNKSGYAITVRGAAFDLRGLLTQVRDRNDKSGNLPDIAIDAKVSKLIGFNQEVMTGAAMSLVSVGGETQKLAFSGAIGDSTVEASYAVTPAGTSLDATSTDAGELMRFLDLYTRFSGGVLRISGRGVGTGPVVGTLDVSDFDVVNEPAMKRISSNNVNRPGFAPATGEINVGRVHFDKMVARFRKTKQVISIEDALLRGAQVGATFAGRYDLSSTVVAITGTYLPAYALNNLFGRVPILGLVMGAGSKEGLFGVTFKIQGPIGQPQVMFNPLSAVAPGIFRKIFTFQP